MPCKSGLVGAAFVVAVTLSAMPSQATVIIDTVQGLSFWATNVSSCPNNPRLEGPDLSPNFIQALFHSCRPEFS